MVRTRIKHSTFKGKNILPSFSLKTSPPRPNTNPKPKEVPKQIVQLGLGLTLKYGLIDLSLRSCLPRFCPSLTSFWLTRCPICTSMSSSRAGTARGRVCLTQRTLFTTGTLWASAITTTPNHGIFASRNLSECRIANNWNHLINILYCRSSKQIKVEDIFVLNLFTSDQWRVVTWRW